jgi:hypothetical protein
MNSDLIDHVQTSISTTLHCSSNTVLPDLLYICRYAGLSSERLRPDILSSCSSHNYDKLQTGPPGQRQQYSRSCWTWPLSCACAMGLSGVHWDKNCWQCVTSAGCWSFWEERDSKRKGNTEPQNIGDSKCSTAKR